MLVEYFLIATRILGISTDQSDSLFELEYDRGVGCFLRFFAEYLSVLQSHLQSHLQSQSNLKVGASFSIMDSFSTVRLPSVAVIKNP